MTKKQDERRSLSYHEAGHAVVAWSLGFRVSKVSIGMDGNDGPVTELDAVLPPRKNNMAIHRRGRTITVGHDRRGRLSWRSHSKAGLRRARESEEVQHEQA